MTFVTSHQTGGSFGQGLNGNSGFREIPPTVTWVFLNPRPPPKLLVSLLFPFHQTKGGLESIMVCLFFEATRVNREHHEENPSFRVAPPKTLLVLSKKCGNEPRDSLKGNHLWAGLSRGYSMSHSLPISHSQEERQEGNHTGWLISGSFHVSFPAYRNKTNDMAVGQNQWDPI